MYSSNSTDNQKYGIPPPPSTAAPPPPDGKPAIGISEGFMNQQPPIQPQPKTRALWSTGLFGCFEDVPNCCMTFWCPCITFGQIAEIVDKGSTSCGTNGAIYTLMALFIGCPWLYSCTYRSKMRDQYMLPESPCGDCLVHCFCETCALCQEYRELQNRGFNVPIGWHKNVERKNHEMAMAPVVQQGMSR